MKLLPAGKLKNLNDLTVGTSVLIADGKVGYVTDVTDVSYFNFNHKTMKGDIAQARLWIDLPMSGSMMHSHRSDGRSLNDAEHDIVKICKPEHSKVKAIKVWSNQYLDIEMLKKGNEIGLICKLIIDTEKNGKSWIGNKKPMQMIGFNGLCRLGKSGVLSVKIWRVA